MNLALSRVTIRRWNTGDVEFSLRVRNHPDLMKYFRQNRALTAKEQHEFIYSDISYNGHVIEADGAPVGLCGVKDTGEFTLAVLPEYQGKGIATKAMQTLIARYHNIWSEVFVGNPALEWFISKLGFSVVGVRERAYYKSHCGLVGVVIIRYE